MNLYLTRRCLETIENYRLIVCFSSAMTEFVFWFRDFIRSLFAESGPPESGMCGNERCIYLRRFTVNDNPLTRHRELEVFYNTRV